jgi:hypothetical protein
MSEERERQEVRRGGGIWGKSPIICLLLFFSPPCDSSGGRAFRRAPARVVRDRRSVRLDRRGRHARRALGPGRQMQPSCTTRARSTSTDAAVMHDSARSTSTDAAVVHDTRGRQHRQMQPSRTTSARSASTDAAVMHDSGTRCGRHVRPSPPLVHLSSTTRALVHSTHPSVVNDRCIGADGQTRRSSTTGAPVDVDDAPRRELVRGTVRDDRRALAPPRRITGRGGEKEKGR